MTHTHTQGPWHLNAGNLCEIDTKACAIAHVYGTASCEAHIASECRANARLIAAAPELLAALLDALPYVEDVLDNPEHLACFKSGVVQSHVASIRAAITKATGRV